MIRLLLLLLALLALTPARAAEPAPSGRLIEYREVAAAGLPRQRLSIWLPPGYDRDTATRYPVLYMHDGHNLFDPAESNFNKIWAADKAMLAELKLAKAFDFRGQAERAAHFVHACRPVVGTGHGVGRRRGKQRGDRALRRRLSGSPSLPANDHAFRATLQPWLDRLPANLSSRHAFHWLPATQPPWHNAGIDLVAGDSVTVLADGRVFLSRPLDIWVGPSFQLWYRIGDRGPVFRGTRATNTFTSRDGVLALDWSDLIGSRKRGPVLTMSGPWRTPRTHLP